jgi:hypothetical protein
MVVVAAVPLACGSDAPSLYAEPWPAANALFTGDAQWVGGDGAYSVDLGHDRVLWLFGDSFIATSDKRTRSESYMVRNSVALQFGKDPTRAFLQFYYRQQDSHPSSFVPEDDTAWFWPGHGIRSGDRALLFYARFTQESEGMWGFASAGWTAFLVLNPDSEPNQWELREATIPEQGREVQLGGAVFQEGDWLYVYGIEGDRHDVHLARFELNLAMNGDLTEPQWWTGTTWGRASERKSVIDFGAPEFSVHYAAELGKYLFVATSGFGASTIAIRVAPTPEGPWSEPRDVLRPEESFDPDAFVYAAKAHPELAARDLAVTYVPSTQEGGPPDTTEQLYYPRFARIRYR